MHDVEGMRAAAGLPSSLVLYFTNSGINSRTALSACMEAMADKVREATDSTITFNHATCRLLRTPFRI
jgi:hypothetical protein